MIIVSKFFSISLVFVTMPLTSGILFSTVVNATFIAKLLKLGIKLAQSDFAANVDFSVLVAFFKSAFVA